MVVNNVPRYEIKMIVDGRKPVAFGKGLALEELKDLSRLIYLLSTETEPETTELIKFYRNSKFRIHLFSKFI